MSKKIKLCKIDGCRLINGHGGQHEPYPCVIWQFLDIKDKKKIVKAGFATPRGGSKGAYQNHVVRSNQVIIPFEKLSDIDISHFRDGYVIRLFPEQYFTGPKLVKPEFLSAESTVIVGKNAFVLYRTHQSLENLPPLPGWKVRSLQRDGKEVPRRVTGVVDVGEYVFRIPRLGQKPAKEEGPPQGIFATEYADRQTNFLCQAVLAWLITKTLDNPYSGKDLSHLEAVLNDVGLLDNKRLEDSGIIHENNLVCPLCSRKIKYSELHEMIVLTDDTALANAAEQVIGATRSTIVNLFHMKPLLYGPLEHTPKNMAWGHAICNTVLGQHECVSMADLKQQARQLALVAGQSHKLFLWISNDEKIIRSEGGGVWIKISEGLT